MDKRFIHVAVGVIKNTQGQILIAKRPVHAHQGGLWEFPGGKVEPTETVQVALARELKEELAIEVLSSSPLIQIRHDYGDKAVMLDVHVVEHFSGNPIGVEGQEVRWVDITGLDSYTFPAANAPIVKAIQFPVRLAITGTADSLQAWVNKITRLFTHFNGGVIVRHEWLSEISSATRLVEHLIAAARERAFIALNTNLDVFVQLQERFPTVPFQLHLNRHTLNTMVQNGQTLPSGVVVGASCHNPEELQLAVRLGVSYALLSPVKLTSSHLDATPLGWTLWCDWVKDVNFPVYALGGVGEADLPQAQAAGGQGIAAISAFWV